MNFKLLAIFSFYVKICARKSKLNKICFMAHCHTYNFESFNDTLFSWIAVLHKRM